MSKDIVLKQNTLPAHLQAAASAKELAKEFSGNVQSGFPVLKYRGKTWRVTKGGEEQVYTNEEGDAIQNVKLVLIKSNESLSKTYYKNGYEEGSQDKPDCWSAGGVSPDPNVPKPVASKCQGCPMNAWGSRTNKETGKKQKACQDVRRMAVIMEHELEAVAEGEKDFEDAEVMLLRVPGGSLNPLKDYVEQKLLPKGGLLPFMLVTRVGFEVDAAYPKFTFKAARFLDEDEFGTVVEFRDSAIVKRILDESAELADGESTEEDDDEPSSDLDANGEGSESASPDSSDDDEDEIAPPKPKKTPKKRAAEVEEESFDEDDEDEIEPPKKKKAAPPKKKKVAKPEPEDDESPVADADDLDDMLDSILG